MHCAAALGSNSIEASLYDNLAPHPLSIRYLLGTPLLGMSPGAEKRT